MPIPREKELAVARIASSGAAVIPKVVRVLLDVKPGDKIAFYLKDNEIVIRKALPKQEQEANEGGVVVEA